jgi:hypothetical protein
MANPVSRITGILGLVMMGAIAYQVVLGQITLVEAGQRGAITLVAVIIVRKLGNLGMSALAGSMEREAAIPNRRQTDVMEEAAAGR